MKDNPEEPRFPQSVYFCYISIREGSAEFQKSAPA